MRVRITWQGGQVILKLRDTQIARRMAHTLPYQSRVQTWVDEVYFKFPVEAEQDADATDVVPPGTVCYWVEGKSIAIPFGPTPIAQEGECRLADQVNVLGVLEDDPEALRGLNEGDLIKLQLLGRVSWES